MKPGIRVITLVALISLFAACSSSSKVPFVEVSGPVAVAVGATVTLAAKTLEGSDSAYAWTSSDPTVATVAPVTGVVTGVKAGTAVISATGNQTGAVGTWGVHVFTGTEPQVFVSGVVGLKIGQTTTLSATTVNGTDSGYTWTSSSDGLATVDAAGTVTGVGEGTVTITATGVDTEVSGDWSLLIYKAPVIPTVTVVVDGPLSVAIKATITLTAATVNGTDSAYAWTSANEAVATVDAAGVVTGVGAGEVVITAKGADTSVEGKRAVLVPPEGIDVPFEAQWKLSGHADATAEAFNHWNQTGSIPVGCARCHSTPGFQDFLGADGTAAGTVDAAAATGTVITCVACHNAAAVALTTVTFPSGLQVGGIGPEARCMQCHQGVESTRSVNDAITAAAVANDDTPGASLSFRNVHYFAAGATLYGGQAQVGYQYAGKPYDIKFAHAAGYDTCIACHDPHTLQPRLTACATCHPGVATAADVRNFRMAGSGRDYNGDGSTTQGIYYEVAGLQDKLYAALKAYAKDTLGTALVYDAATYPYFFIDTNANGTVDTGEAVFANAYNKWSPRLLRAAYNYQFSEKDPGGYVHNAKYLIQLLYDGVADLNSALGTPVDLAAANRDDPGHFDGAGAPFRHFDAEGGVQAGCSRCHSAEGLPFYLQTRAAVAQPLPNGFTCATCHPDVPQFATQLAVPGVTFPSGQVVDSGSNTSNLCITCHQGLESTASVDRAVGANPADTVQSGLAFLNVHYFAAGATMFGTQAKVGYEYAGKSYDGRFAHVNAVLNCNNCHDVHTQEVQVGVCGQCHEGAATLADTLDIRMAGSTEDHDGDGNTTEGIWHEIDGLRAKLYAAIRLYAGQIVATKIVYSAAAYPYFFVDTNGDGALDPAEASYGNRYVTWTPRLLKAAYNYQFSQKDPGGYTHNAKYIIELLVDSIADLATQVTIDVDALRRNDAGHFDGTAMAFRDWDAAGAVPAGCARCHSVAGFSEYLDTGATPTTARPVVWGFACETCHTGAAFASGAPLKVATQVTFPSGVQILNTGTPPDTSFLCMTCHQGRIAKKQVDAAILAGTLAFQNVHYLSAGATLYGSEATVGYEYPGKTYEGKWLHVGGTSAHCVFCHEVTAERHAFAPQLKSACQACHTEATAGIESIRKGRAGDYNGNGSTTETLKAEVQGLADLLLARIQVVATANAKPIAYDAGSYPYFFNDSNGNGAVDPAEATSANSYSGWTAPLIKAAHNYQIHQKEPGEWAHNTYYAIQLLYDSIQDLGGDVGTLTRP